MALARIITRSQACSRELALDLLARGYAVEIVSPERVPDNIADLELRVDTDLGDQLIATVEAHGLGHSASLDFVHQLKTPMGDFIRRTPDPTEAAAVSQKPIGLAVRSTAIPAQTAIAAPTEIEDVRLPVIAPPPDSNILPSVAARPDPECDLHAGASLIPRLTSSPAPFPALDAPTHPALPESEMVPLIPAAGPTLVQPARSRRPRLHSGRFWRVGLTFASLVLVALVLGFGVYRNGKPVAPVSATSLPEKVLTASADMNLSSVTEPPQPSVQDSATVQSAEPQKASQLAPSSPPVKSAAGSSSQESAVAKLAAAPTVNARSAARPSHPKGNHDNDLVARDTVTYLDEGYRPVTKPKPAKRHVRRTPSSRKHDGLVAPNSVSHLSNNPAPIPPQ